MKIGGWLKLSVFHSTFCNTAKYFGSVFQSKIQAFILVDYASETEQVMVVNECINARVFSVFLWYIKTFRSLSDVFTPCISSITCFLCFWKTNSGAFSFICFFTRFCLMMCARINVSALMGQIHSQVYLTVGSSNVFVHPIDGNSSGVFVRSFSQSLNHKLPCRLWRRRWWWRNGRRRRRDKRRRWWMRDGGTRR